MIMIRQILIHFDQGGTETVHLVHNNNNNKTPGEH